MVGSQIIPGIIMVGVVLVFYRIPITEELVKCVQARIYPSEVTIVQRCTPPVPNPSAYAGEGLVPLANRVVVMRCFEAFKAFSVSFVQVHVVPHLVVMSRAHDRDPLFIDLTTTHTLYSPETCNYFLIVYVNGSLTSSSVPLNALAHVLLV